MPLWGFEGDAHDSEARETALQPLDLFFDMRADGIARAHSLEGDSEFLVHRLPRYFCLCQGAAYGCFALLYRVLSDLLFARLAALPSLRVELKLDRAALLAPVFAGG